MGTRGLGQTPKNPTHGYKVPLAQPRNAQTDLTARLLGDVCAPTDFLVLLPELCGGRPDAWRTPVPLARPLPAIPRFREIYVELTPRSGLF
jgi:hypothetical protein